MIEVVQYIYIYSLTFLVKNMDLQLIPGINGAYHIPSLTFVLKPGHKLTACIMDRPDIKQADLEEGRISGTNPWNAI